MAKRAGLIDRWREASRRGDGKPGGCGHWVSEIKGGRDRCVRCDRDLGPADAR